VAFRAEQLRVERLLAELPYALEPLLLIVHRFLNLAA